MNKQTKSIRIFTDDRPGHVGVGADDRQHLNHDLNNNTIRQLQLPSTGRSMVGRCSTARADFGIWASNPKFSFIREQTTPANLRTEWPANQDPRAPGQRTRGVGCCGRVVVALRNKKTSAKSKIHGDREIQTK